MKLSEYSDDEICCEVKRRGLELKVRIDSVDVSVSLGNILFGETTCKESK